MDDNDETQGSGGGNGREDMLLWLEHMRTEHRDLDQVIHYMISTGHRDHMQIQRLKKRKLRLKDMIARLESKLIPDLDA